MPEFQIVCLANSRKLTGRCVAGLRTDGGGWIRPVSDLPDGTLFTKDYTLDDGSVTRLLDLVRIPVVAPRPEPHQPENWLLDPGRWGLVERIRPESAALRLERFLVHGPDLLGNQSDRVSVSLFKRNPAMASLALVEPNDVEWEITRSRTGKRQTRARFQLGGVFYDLVVTDPKWEEQLRGHRYGKYPLGEVGVRANNRVLFTLSLGEPFGGYCYKLVAAVLVLPVTVSKGRKNKSN